MLSDIRDATTIPMPSGGHRVPTRQQHRYYDMLRVGDCFIKLASDYFYEVVDRSPVFSRPGPTLNPIRRPDEEEFPANLGLLLNRYPAFAESPISSPHLHFLLIHKLHYDRLKQRFPDNIPDAAFVLVEADERGSWPAIVQRAVSGRTLLELMDQPPQAGERLQIAQQLSAFDESPHIDWAFENFIWSDQALFYVDSKPTLFRTERRNEENKRVLTKRFVDGYARLISTAHGVGRHWWEFWRS